MFNIFDKLIDCYNKSKYHSLITIPVVVDIYTGIVVHVTFYMNDYDGRKVKFITNTNRYDIKKSIHYAQIIYPFLIKSKTPIYDFTNMESTVKSLYKIVGFHDADMMFTLSESNNEKQDTINKSEGNIIHFPNQKIDHGDSILDE